jgi:hypothetical protein
MITDTNSVIGFASNLLGGITGGDIILMGFLFFLIVTVGLIMAKVKASTAVMVGVSIAFMFAFYAGAFIVIFWIALIAALFVLINGLRKWITGQ